MLDALSPQRRRLVLAAVGLVLAVLLVIVLTVVVRSVRGFGGAAPQDQPGPVLLVPGYGGNADSLAPLEIALRAAGRQVVVVTPPGTAPAISGPRPTTWRRWRPAPWT